MSNSLPVICIVDDDARSARVLELALQDEYEIHIFTDAFEGYRKIPDLCPEAILLDIDMPQIDGLKLCHKFKQTNRTASIPVIFVSGLDANTEEARAFGYGADDYVSKPVDPAKLKARISRAVQASLYVSFLEHLVEHKDQTIQSLKQQSMGFSGA